MLSFRCLNQPAVVTVLAVLLGAAGMTRAGDYAVVVSEKTAKDAAWRKVADALVVKHAGELLTFKDNVAEVLPALQKQFPKYVCFVATPDEAGREFVRAVHQLTRRIDDDPYTDCLWGIVTGYDAAGALKLAAESKPLVIHKAASGTEIALDQCDEGLWYCELNKGKMVRKEPGKSPTQQRGPDDSTKAIVDTLNEYRADLFVTSGHATERDWMIGFRYRNGFFRCENGQLYGLDTQGEKHPVKSDNPKVYLPVGNCLMGHVDSKDAMAVAYMNSAGVRQMIGYTVPTWYGYAGWGMLDYFVEQPGRYTCAQAFVAAQNALIHRLATNFPDLLQQTDGVNYRGPITLTPAAKSAGLTAMDGRGLLHDRDVLAFYGDPAWEAKMADHPNAYDQVLTEADGVWTLEIKPNRGAASFDPINTNGAQRGYRPIIQFLPARLKDVKILEGDHLKPMVADDFVLIPHPGQCDPAKTYRVKFSATRIGAK